MFNSHCCVCSLVSYLILFYTYLQFCTQNLSVIMNFATKYVQKVHLLICLNLLPNSLRNFQFSVMGNNKPLLSTCHLHVVCDVIDTYHIFPQSSPFLDRWIPVHLASLRNLLVFFTILDHPCYPSPCISNTGYILTERAEPELCIQHMGKWGIYGGVTMFSDLFSFPLLIIVQILFYC